MVELPPVDTFGPEAPVGFEHVGYYDPTTDELFTLDQVAHIPIDDLEPVYVEIPAAETPWDSV